MKKIAIAIIFLFAFTTQKSANVKPETIASIQNTLGTIYNYIDKSNLPHQDVLQIEQMIKNSNQLLQRDIDSTR